VRLRQRSGAADQDHRLARPVQLEQRSAARVQGADDDIDEIEALGDPATYERALLDAIGIAERTAAAAPLAVSRLSLRVTFSPDAGTATLQLDAASEPISLRYRAGTWRLADAVAR